MQYAMCDLEGKQYLLLAGIVDHRKEDLAINKTDAYIKHGSNFQLRKTTKGWKLCVDSFRAKNSLTIATDGSLLEIAGTFG